MAQNFETLIKVYMFIPNWICKGDPTTDDLSLNACTILHTLLNSGWLEDRCVAVAVG